MKTVPSSNVHIQIHLYHYIQLNEYFSDLSRLKFDDGLAPFFGACLDTLCLLC